MNELNEEDVMNRLALLMDSSAALSVKYLAVEEDCSTEMELS